jgi:hypothetical protein
VPETSGVEEVEADGAGSWEAAGEALPVLAGSDGSILAVVATRGSGRMTLVADASPLRNRLLARASNAAFGVAVAGEPGRAVEFVESVHGYGRGTGLAAVPGRWQWATAGLGLAALLFLWARGRRLGPPEEETRELPPPRRDYVESVAALLARTKRPGEAAAPLRLAVRERLARRLDASAEADDEALRQAAVRAGLTADEVAASLGPAPDGRALLGAARALARLHGDARGRT